MQFEYENGTVYLRVREQRLIVTEDASQMVFEVYRDNVKPEEVLKGLLRKQGYDIKGLFVSSGKIHIMVDWEQFSQFSFENSYWIDESPWRLHGGSADDAYQLALKNGEFYPQVGVGYWLSAYREEIKGRDKRWADPSKCVIINRKMYRGLPREYGGHGHVNLLVPCEASTTVPKEEAEAFLRDSATVNLRGGQHPLWIKEEGR